MTLFLFFKYILQFSPWFLVLLSSDFNFCRQTYLRRFNSIHFIRSTFLYLCLYINLSSHFLLRSLRFALLYFHRSRPFPFRSASYVPIGIASRYFPIALIYVRALPGHRKSGLSPKGWKNQMEREYMDTDKCVFDSKTSSAKALRFCLANIRVSWIPGKAQFDRGWNWNRSSLGKIAEKSRRRIPCIRFYPLLFLLSLLLLLLALRPGSVQGWFQFLFIERDTTLLSIWTELTFLSVESVRTIRRPSK